MRIKESVYSEGTGLSETPGVLMGDYVSAMLPSNYLLQIISTMLQSNYLLQIMLPSSLNSKARKSPVVSGQKFGNWVCTRSKIMPEQPNPYCRYIGLAVSDIGAAQSCLT